MILDWVLAGFLAALFLAAGVVKFARPEGNARDAARWRVPVRFVQAVGVAELVAAPLLLWPTSRFASCLFLAVVMIGAIGMQIRVRGWKEIVHPTVTLGLVAWLALRTLTHNS